VVGVQAVAILHDARQVAVLATARERQRRAEFPATLYLGDDQLFEGSLILGFRYGPLLG
jgi:hypothetical protein